MPLNPLQIFKRRSIRIPHFEYGKGYSYFVTICTQNKKCLFGEIKNDEIHLNTAGEKIKNCWINISSQFPGTAIEPYVIMPNHVHGIISISGQSTLPKLMQWFKSLTTHEYIQGVRVEHWEPFDWKLWQRNYYEHVIRTEDDYQRIYHYIIDNPKNWHNDENYRDP